MDTKLGYMRLPLEVHGAEIAQRRVPARRVVEALDIIEHVGLRVIARSICLPADPFGLHRREEALQCRVVPDVARPAHRAGDAIVGHQPLELLACVLGGLNRSSQRFENGGVDGQQEAAFGSVHTATIAVARSAAGGHARRAAAVLDVNHDGDQQRGGCAKGWGIATCRNEMVPEGGRYATSDVQARGEAAVRKVSVPGRARGYRAAARPGS